MAGRFEIAIVMVLVAIAVADAVWDPLQHPSINVVQKEHINSMPSELSGLSKDYDGMMFAGGMQTDKHGATWVARVCTSGCREPPYNSAIVLGSVQRTAEEASSSEEALWSWTNMSQMVVSHSDKGLTTGPEDPRLDSVEGDRFILTSVNIANPQQSCPSDAESPSRKQVFVAVDPAAGPEQCIIQVDEPGFDHCADQKNWAPLVPLGSENIFLVYSLKPFQVMSFDRQLCKARSVTNGGMHAADFSQVRGGTRYVHGMDVAEGAVYWSVAHTPPLDYQAVLTAVLVRTSPLADGASPSFELLGMSCGLTLPGLLGADNTFSYPNSILSFDKDMDSADVTFHIDDRENKVVTIQGVKQWLDMAYIQWKETGTFQCSHYRKLAAKQQNVTTTTTSEQATSTTTTATDAEVTTTTTSEQATSTTTTATDAEAKTTTTTTITSAQADKSTKAGVTTTAAAVEKTTTAEQEPSSTTTAVAASTSRSASGSQQVTTIRGSLQMSVPDCAANLQGVRSATRAGLAKLASVPAEFVLIDATCARRMTTSDFLPRRLQDSVQLDYSISIPESDTEDYAPEQIASTISTATPEEVTTQIRSEIPAGSNIELVVTGIDEVTVESPVPPGVSKAAFVASAPGALLVAVLGSLMLL